MPDKETQERVERVDVDSNANKVIDWLKNHVSAIFLIGLSIYFVFNGAIAFIFNTMDWWELIVYCFTGGLFGLVITQLVGESGYTAGKESEAYICTRNQAIEFCEKALPMRKEAELYVSKKIDKDIKEERIEILSKASINYNEVFSDNDVPYSYKSLKHTFSRKQLKAVRQAIKIKKVPFALFGFTSVKSVGRKEAPNENKRRRNKFSVGFAMKIIIAIATGTVSVSFIGISVSSMIYSFCSLMVWFGSGLITRLSNYNFIVNTVREYDQERIWYLKEFLSLPENEKKALQEEVSLKESQEEEIKRIGMIIDNNSNND